MNPNEKKRHTTMTNDKRNILFSIHAFLGATRDVKTN